MVAGQYAWPALRLAFSLGLLAVVASRVDLGQMAHVLAGADLRLVLLAWLLALASWVLASYKWRLLLRALDADAPLTVLCSLNLVGLFYSLFLPGQLGGEVVKGIKLAGYGVSGATTTVTIGLDRLTGVMALALLALGGLALAPESAATPAMKLLALAVLLMSLSPLLALAPPFSAWSGVLAGEPTWAWGPARAAIRLLGALVGAFLQYRRSPGTLLVALGLSLAVQTTVVAVNYLAALGLGLQVPFLALTWIVALASLLHLVPVSLAGLGVREGAYVLLLQGYGVPDAAGLGLALLVFGVIVAQGLVGGVIDLALGLPGKMPSPPTPLPQEENKEPGTRNEEQKARSSPSPLVGEGAGGWGEPRPPTGRA